MRYSQEFELYSGVRAFSLNFLSLWDKVGCPLISNFRVSSNSKIISDTVRPSSDVVLLL